MPRGGWMLSLCIEACQIAVKRDQILPEGACFVFCFEKVKIQKNFTTKQIGDVSNIKTFESNSSHFSAVPSVPRSPWLKISKDGAETAPGVYSSRLVLSQRSGVQQKIFHLPGRRCILLTISLLVLSFVAGTNQVIITKSHQIQLLNPQLEPHAHRIGPGIVFRYEAAS